MSKDQTNNTEPHEAPKEDYYGNVELEKKLMQIGPEQKYTVDARQNGESRFCRLIQEGQSNRRTRVVIPMSIIPEFCQMLVELTKFASTYNPKNVSEKKSPRDRTNFAHSEKLTTPGGRRYYFDIVDADDTLTARISYVFAERAVVYIVVDALSSLVQLFQEFQKKYPSQTTEDDYSLINRKPRFNRYSQTGRSGRGYGRGRYRRPYGAGRSQYPSSNPDAPATDRPTEPRRTGNLKVLQDPAPTQVVHNSKKFTFEVVEGDNTFLRITEMINDNRKSTLHVPIEVCPQMQTLIAEMNQKLTATVSKKPAAAPTPAPSSTSKTN